MKALSMNAQVKFYSWWNRWNWRIARQ